MRPDERAFLELLAALSGVRPSLSLWYVSQLTGHPIHDRRLEHFARKWERKGYWDPLKTLSGDFTPEGWDWLAGMGIRRGGPLTEEAARIAAELREVSRNW